MILQKTFKINYFIIYFKYELINYFDKFINKRGSKRYNKFNSEKYQSIKFSSKVHVFKAFLIKNSKTVQINDLKKDKLIMLHKLSLL